MKNSKLLLLAGGPLLQLLSCQAEPAPELRDYLTFHASFDQGASADFALGDANIYTASSRKEMAGMQVGQNNPDHRIAEGEGRFGSAFEFGKRSETLTFFKSKGNVAYDPENWSGTISFWLSVDPATDLDGYTDPIQITDTSYNDASIWVDFTDEPPRDFRLGVIGDRAAWNPETDANTPNPGEFERRVLGAEATQFSRDTWTHVLITYSGLGSADDSASLYLNGQKVGSIAGIGDPFNWNLDKSKIFLGLNFTGLMDELSIFNKPLTDSQAMDLYQLEGGVTSLL